MKEPIAYLCAGEHHMTFGVLDYDTDEEGFCFAVDVAFLNEDGEIDDSVEPYLSDDEIDEAVHKWATGEDASDVAIRQTQIRARLIAESWYY